MTGLGADGLLSKHAVKQVDRLLSNAGVSAWEMFAQWVPEAVGSRKEIVVAMDWTDFDADGQATLALNLVTGHGRATPLLWLTMLKEELAGQRNDIEDACLARLAGVLPAGTKATILADRGFGDRKLFDYLTKLGRVCHPVPRRYPRRRRGWRKPRGGQVGRQGRPGAPSARGIGHRRRATGWRRRLCPRQGHEGALVSGDEQGGGNGARNRQPLRQTLDHRAQFRDTKDLRFGMGLGAVRIGDPQRRDRLLLLNAFAVLFLTLLGEAGEALGMDRRLKVNTVKRRTHSLFRQGCMLYDLIPAMPEPRLRPLIERFLEMLKNRPITAQLANIA